MAKTKADDRVALSVAEAARLASVSPETIRRELDDGNLQGVRMRDRRLVLRESLEKALKPKR